MKIIPRLTLLILVGFLVACKPNLISFSPPDKSFTIKLAAKPNVVTAPADKQAHIIGSQSYGVISEQREYILTYSDFDPNFFSQLPQKVLFDTFTLGVAGKDKLMSEIKINMNGNPGRQLNLMRSDGRLRLTRYYIVGQRVYELDVTLKLDEKSSPKADVFFDSFKLNGSIAHTLIVLPVPTGSLVAHQRGSACHEWQL